MTSFVDEGLVAAIEHKLITHFDIPTSNDDITLWLSDTKKRIQEPLSPMTRVLFVLGNEAADLDSCVSAISYAYLVHHSLQQPILRPIAPQAVQDSLHDGKTDWIVAPVINIAEEDLALRTLFSRLARLAGFDESNLLFAHSPLLEPFLSTTPMHTPTIVLVDHCIPCPAQQHLTPLVAAIIDHHVDQDCAPVASPRLIVPCASTASLVALHAHMALTTAFSDVLREPARAHYEDKDSNTLTPLRAQDEEEHAHHRLRVIAASLSLAHPVPHSAMASALATAVIRAFLPSIITDVCAPTLFTALQCGPHPAPTLRTCIKASIAATDSVDAADAALAPLCLGDLLAATIAVDSVGMAPAAGKRTEVDERSLQVLGWGDWVIPVGTTVSSVGAGHSTGRRLAELAPLFALLSALLRDTAALTAAQCLRLDMKVAVTGGYKVLIASIPRTMDEYADPTKAEELVRAIYEDMKRQSADAVVLCCLGIRDTGVERDVCIVGTGPLFASIDSVLSGSTLRLSHHALSNAFVQICSQYSLCITTYNQGDVKQSRKQIMPLVMQAMQL